MTSIVSTAMGLYLQLEASGVLAVAVFLGATAAGSVSASLPAH